MPNRASDGVKTPMSTKQGFSLSGLISNFMTKLSGKKTQAEQNDDMKIECRNPWQHNLERLARVETRYIEEPPVAEKTDSLTSFVTDLAKATFDEENSKTEATKNDSPKNAPNSKKLANRLGDRTITDMKAWWQDSLGTTEVQAPGTAAQNAELPGRARLLKRWFE